MAEYQEYQDYDEYYEEPSGRNQTWLVVAIVIVVLILCCCCLALVVALGVFGGDILNELGNIAGASRDLVDITISV